MNTFIPTFIGVLSIVASSFPAQAAKSVPVVAKDGGKTFKGDLYLPTNPKGPVPLVLVIHEWWGKNDYAEKRAAQIADELGYAALAVDLFGKTAATPKEAQAQALPFYGNPKIGVKRLEAFEKAAPAAAKAAKVELAAGKVAAVGYCFGGTQALNLARADHSLTAAVAIHAGLASKLKSDGKMPTKILVLHGDADQFVKPDEVAAFKKEMEGAGANLTFIGYPGATHAFSNPDSTATGKKFGMPIAYDEKADKASWQEEEKFLKTTLGGAVGG